MYMCCRLFYFWAPVSKVPLSVQCVGAPPRVTTQREQGRHIFFLFYTFFGGVCLILDRKNVKVPTVPCPHRRRHLCTYSRKSRFPLVRFALTTCALTGAESTYLANAAVGSTSEPCMASRMARLSKGLGLFRLVHFHWLSDC